MNCTGRNLVALAAVLMFCVPQMNAQTFSVESRRVVGEVGLGEYPELTTLVTNLTTRELHLRISKKENMPPEWKAQMCFFQACLGSEVSERDGDMEANFSEELGVGFYDLTSRGIGEVAVKIENLDDASDTVTVVFVLAVDTTIIDTTTSVHFPAILPMTLLQNYPNPVWRSTLLPFDLERPMTVSLSVTDALGREVARLVDQMYFRSGRHSVRLNIESLPTGVYLYRLETEEAVLVRKMVVMR